MYEARQNKEKVSRRIQVGKHQETQLRGGKLTMNNPQINHSVKQLRLIHVAHNSRNWRSTANFDNNHLGPTPTTNQGWVDWRTSRWPGFLTGADMLCTLITGDLNQEISNGNYNNLNINGDRFEVTVQCTCTTVNPYNTGNPIAVNNIDIRNYASVIIGGYYNTNRTNVIDHLSQGI